MGGGWGGRWPLTKQRGPVQKFNNDISIGLLFLLYFLDGWLCVDGQRAPTINHKMVPGSAVAGNRSPVLYTWVASLGICGGALLSHIQQRQPTYIHKQGVRTLVLLDQWIRNPDPNPRSRNGPLKGVELPVLQRDGSYFFFLCWVAGFSQNLAVLHVVPRSNIQQFFTNPIHNTGIYHPKLYNNKSPKQDITYVRHKYLKVSFFSYERKETLYLGNPGYSARHMSSFQGGGAKHVGALLRWSADQSPPPPGSHPSYWTYPPLPIPPSWVVLLSFRLSPLLIFITYTCYCQGLKGIGTGYSFFVIILYSYIFSLMFMLCTGI